MAATPLPMRQVLTVAAIQTVTSFCMNLVTPISPFMIQDFYPSLDKEQVGYYSGYLIGAYFVGQLVGSIIWGSLADRFGRRPIIIIGLLFTFVTVAVFAFSLNFYQALVARFFWGALNGNIVVVKTYLSEICDDSNQAKGMAALSTCFGLGQMLGPSVGGTLARPASKWSPFQGIWLFTKFPYFLSCLPAIVCCLTAAAGAYFCLPETHQYIHSRYNALVDEPDLERQSSSTKQLLSSPVEPPSPLQDLPPHRESVVSTTDTIPTPKQPTKITAGRGVMLYIRLLTGLPGRPIFAYAIHGFVTIALNTVFPLLLLNDIQLGGFGYDTTIIGSILAMSGPMQIIGSPVIFPWLAKRIGCCRFLQTFPFAWGILVSLIPFATLLPLIPWLRFAVLAAMFMLQSVFQNLTYTAAFIIINNSVTAEMRGRVNGLGQSVVSFARIIGPSACSTLFAVTCEASLPWPLDYHCTFHAIGLISISLALWCLSLPKKLDHKPDKPNPTSST